MTPAGLARLMVDLGVDVEKVSAQFKAPSPISDSLQRSYELENAWNEGFLAFVDGERIAKYDFFLQNELWGQWRDGFSYAQETFTNG